MNRNQRAKQRAAELLQKAADILSVAEATEKDGVLIRQIENLVIRLAREAQTRDEE